jgi:hypothetical protein
MSSQLNTRVNMHWIKQSNNDNKKQPKEIMESAEPTSPELSEAALEQVADGESVSTGKHVIKGTIEVAR